MFEQVFKNIDDVLHKDAGCSSELVNPGTPYLIRIMDAPGIPNIDYCCRQNSKMALRS